MKKKSNIFSIKKLKNLTNVSMLDQKTLRKIKGGTIIIADVVEG